MDWLTLIRAPRLGSAGALRLLQHCGSAAGCFTSDLPPSLELHAETRAYLRAPDRKAADQDYAWMQGSATRLLTVTDPAYPPLLRQIPDPPFALFVRGDASLLSEPQLAMVGSRNPSVEGRRNAEEFAAYLAQCGLVIVSGMALGIDACAHRAALDAGGRTVAVLGTGVDVAYPRAHEALHAEIGARGLLLSELPPGAHSHGGSFPMRNRIIAALSSLVIVVEAPTKSGALITARHAADLGREVAMVPGPIDSPQSQGTNEHLRDGAHAITSIADALYLAKLAPQPHRAGEPQLDDEIEARVWEALSNGAASLDELCARASVPVARCLTAVTALELRGAIECALTGEIRRR